MKVKFTELNSGYKGERKVSRLSEKGKAKLIIVGALVLSFVLVFVLSLVGIIPVDALLVRARVSFSGEDDNFPIRINTDSTVDYEIVDDGLVLLTSDNVIVYGSKGKETYSKPHIYSKPAINSGDDSTIVYDRGGTGFMLLNSKKFVYEGNAPGRIFSAVYGSDGSYALGTTGENSATTLYVYNQKHEVVFKWNCAHEYISSIALSDNGKYIGVSVVGAENGETLTKVNLFGVDYKEPLKSFKIPNAVPLGMSFTKNDVLTIITDTGVYVADKDNEKVKNDFSYYSTEFSCCDVSNRSMCLVGIAKYGSKNVFEANIFDSSGDLKTSFTVNDEVSQAYITDKYVLFLAEDNIYVYNLKGKLVSTTTYKGDIISLSPTDDFIYIESLDNIYRCFTYGDSSIELNS